MARKFRLTHKKNYLEKKKYLVSHKSSSLQPSKLTTYTKALSTSTASTCFVPSKASSILLSSIIASSSTDSTSNITTVYTQSCLTASKSTIASYLTAPNVTSTTLPSSSPTAPTSSIAFPLTLPSSSSTAPTSSIAFPLTTLPSSSSTAPTTSSTAPTSSIAFPLTTLPSSSSTAPTISIAFPLTTLPSSSSTAPTSSIAFPLTTLPSSSSTAPTSSIAFPLTTLPSSSSTAPTSSIAFPLTTLPSSSSSTISSLSIGQLSEYLRFSTQLEEWCLITPTSDIIQLCIFNHTKAPPVIARMLEISASLTWTLYVYRCQIGQPQNKVVSLCNLPTSISSVADVFSILNAVKKARICKGNEYEKFSSVLNVHGDGRHLRSAQGSVVAFHDELSDSIRHIQCPYLFDPATKGAQRCVFCTRYRDNYLRRTLNRMKQADKENHGSSEPSSHTNYRWLTSQQKDERLHHLHNEVRLKSKALHSLQAKVQQMCYAEGLELDSEVNNDLLAIMKDCSESALRSCEPNSFQAIFWQQQLKAASLQNAKSMRWHPLLIKWCLYLQYRSSGAYEALRSSGVIKLPSGRTLRDYKHFARAVSGFSADYDQQLIEIVKKTSPVLGKYVAILVDEMYVKEGLVFDKHSGALTGFVDLGDVTTHLLDYEQCLSSPTGIKALPRRPLAKTIVVLMVRGLLCDIHFPFATFPASSMKGCDLFPLLWSAVERLTRLDFKVLAVTCDGASCNRKMFSMHGKKNELVHKTTNVYSKDHHTIYFICDPPHTMKTIRNCLESNKRNLWCCGSDMKWEYIRKVYENNCGAITSTPGLALTPKLRYEHIHLTNFSKMRVDLATQVLSESVSQALQDRGGEEASEMSHFISLADKFFDCLNVSAISKGKLKLKSFQNPYRCENDFRLKFLTDEFMGYLKRWEESVKQRPGFTDAEKKIMLLSQNTLTGIRITVHSFVELVPELLKVSGAKLFLSERINQDPLEKYFGRIRQQGKTNLNPTVAESLKSAQTLRVIDGIWIDDITGNCRGRRKLKFAEAEDHKPLPKRNRKRRSS